MSKLDELIKKRVDEIESEKRENEAAEEAQKKEFLNSLIMYPCMGGGIGIVLGIVVGFFKGCGLFHYKTAHAEKVYLFDIKDAKQGFLTFVIVGAIAGLLYALLSSGSKK